MSNRNCKNTATASQADFSRNVDVGIQRSKFYRPQSLKTTFNSGRLIPVYIDEVLPGDTFQMDISALTRMSTVLFPTMDDLNLEFYAFFVPNRLVWDGWEQLNGENKTGAWTPSIEPALVPQVNVAGVGANTTLPPTFYAVNTVSSKCLGDYYGLPVGTDLSRYPVSCLPFRGYALIWNEWFRDENLQAPVPVNTGNTFDVGANLTSEVYRYGPNTLPFYVNKYHDYFTSALPAPQKGDSPLIPIELNELIPVVTGATHVTSGGQTPLHVRVDGDSTDLISLNASRITGDDFVGIYSSGGSVSSLGNFTPSNLWADGRGIQLNSSTISELRTAFQIQKLYEKDARGGSRYIEMLKAHFGVDAGDYRLQRPEFLGRYVTRVGMQSVPQTSASVSGQTPQANLAAYSVTAVNNAHMFSKSFVEHGFVHIFAVARQVKTYQQGIEKFWSRKERFDFYYPTLAHISEQPILNKEIYALGFDGDGVFGYQEAWADYRYKPNRVSGQMRSGVKNSLDVWHYADVYSSTPRLGSSWIQDNSQVNVNRTLAVSSTVDDQIKADIRFDCVAVRPMPVNSIPGLVDHF